MSNHPKNTNNSKKEIIYGKNACFGCITGKNRTIYNIYLLSTKWNDYYNKIPEHLKKLVKKCDSKEMFMLTHDENKHQGIALKVSNYNFYSLDELLEKTQNKEKVSIYLLDRVQDPHNIGNIVRTAFCFDIDAIILTEKESCNITSAVVRTSAGYTEHSIICKIQNINNAIEKLKKNCFWIIGFDVNTNTRDDLNKIIQKYNKCVFIFGSEGNGMKETAKEKCDILIKLPMKEGAESLNVANTTTIIGWEVFNRK